MSKNKTTFLKVEPSKLHKQLLISNQGKVSNNNNTTQETFRIKPPDILNRVKSFLPQLISENEKLSSMKENEIEQLDIEKTDDCNQVIEMSISMVDNELLVSDDDGSKDSSSDSSSEDDSENEQKLKQKKVTSLVEEITESTENT